MFPKLVSSMGYCDLWQQLMLVEKGEDGGLPGEDLDSILSGRSIVVQSEAKNL